MARLAKWKAEQRKDIIKASNAKPEKPRIQDQLVLDKNLLDMQKSLTADDKKIDDDMYGELSEKWKGNGGGGSGDAFITGLSAGLRKGESSEEKEKTKKIIKFNEQIRKMVAEQNVQLFEAEKLDKARNSVAPRIMAYLDSYQKMSPNDRKVYLQNAMEEYNQSAGTNYKITDATGSEPWKVIVSDDGNLMPLDLMDFIKTPEEKKLDYYYKSAENQQYEKELGQEDDLERQVMQSKITGNQEIARQKYAKAQQEDEKSPKKIQERKKQMIESGEIPEGSLLFDELPKHEAAEHFKDIKNERDKLKGAEDANKALDEMEKIFEKYPDISTSFAKWAESGDDSAGSAFLRRMSNQDERAALLDLEKHAGKLNLGTIEQFKGTRPTDILKKVMVSTNPGSKFTAKAFKPLKEDYVNQNNYQIDKSKEANRAILKRYVPTYEGIHNSNQRKQEGINITALEQERNELLQKRDEILKKAQN